MEHSHHQGLGGEHLPSRRLKGELARGKDNDKDVEQVVLVLDRMAKQTLTYCSDSSLDDCLELFRSSQ